ncbi:uncharacterized protein LTR77_009964 [Saxophila tyrrhenica]|uniref:Major facilitator superfamily (MFS) profile domain-containing protein n=1 Tax=Saxophila tyrrhenica TaxID=1690608 RepID=A0AAV9NZ57_9PEZI|nr:hypothetical protein LTR77_009964 [Saxophila tyrrhenica]
MLHNRNNRATGVNGVNLKDVVPQRRLWIFCPRLLTLNLLLVGALCAGVTNGFDNSLLNGLQLLDTWQRDFGSPESAWLGLISTANRLGALVALPFVSPLQTKLGRRYPVICGSAIMLVGITIQASSQSVPMFIVGRIILGAGNQLQITTCPVLISELAYPTQRATYTALMNSTGSVGQILAAWITFGSSSLEPSSWSWRTPVAIQAASSIFQIVMMFFIPESPRWLVANNRTDEARHILVKYHGEGCESSPLVNLELAEITHILKTDKKKSSWLAWFHGPSNRHRFAIVFTLGFINAIISYYLRLLLESFGITNSTTQLLINGGNTINAWLFAILWACTIDFWGRRKLFLTGIGGMFCCFLTMTVLASQSAASDFADSSLARPAVAMIFLFGAFYKMVGTTQDPYFGEIASFELRDKAYVIKQFADSAANIFSGFTNPVALDAIGWKYYIVWCCMLVSHFTIVYFVYPETKGLSLEEITQRFDGTEVPENAVRDGMSKEDVSSACTRASTEREGA